MQKVNNNVLHGVMTSISYKQKKVSNQKKNFVHRQIIFIKNKKSIQRNKFCKNFINKNEKYCTWVSNKIYCKTNQNLQ